MAGGGTNSLLLLVMAGRGMSLVFNFFDAQDVWLSRVGLGSALAGYRYVMHGTVLSNPE